MLRNLCSTILLNARLSWRKSTSFVPPVAQNPDLLFSLSLSPPLSLSLSLCYYSYTAGEIHFNLMAIVTDRKMQLERQIAQSESQRDMAAKRVCWVFPFSFVTLPPPPVLSPLLSFSLPPRVPLSFFFASHTSLSLPPITNHPHPFSRVSPNMGVTIIGKLNEPT